MRAVIVFVGTLGETLPSIALGKRLKQRGHSVVILGNDYYSSLYEEAGLEQVGLISADEYRDFLQLAEAWKRSNGFLKDFGYDKFRRWNEIVYEQVVEHHTSDTVVIAVGYFFGARVAQEKLGLPLATIHLQPMWFRSTYHSPAFPRWTPRVVPRLIDRIFDVMIDSGIAKPLNDFRAELGLPPARRVLKHWWHSPDLVLGTFPDWFAPIEPDFPPRTVLTGFPIERSSDFDSSEVDEFLAAGDPPVVFSLSSLTNDAKVYFEASAEVVRRLGCRAVFLTPYREQLPARLPDGIRHFSFVPLDVLLPRALAHVHSCGVGTTAQTLAAGIPHLVVPQGFDDVDMSLRLQRLGVSRTIRPHRYDADAATRELKWLIESPAARDKCRYYARRMRESDPIDNLCDEIEKLYARKYGASAAAAAAARAATAAAS